MIGDIWYQFFTLMKKNDFFLEYFEEGYKNVLSGICSLSQYWHKKKEL